MLSCNRQAILDEITRAEAIAADNKVKAATLMENKTAVQERLTNIVKQAAGWSTLDPWAQNALDSVKNNKIVDLTQLDAEIAAWVAAQGNT